MSKLELVVCQNFCCGALNAARFAALHERNLVRTQPEIITVFLTVFIMALRPIVAICGTTGVGKSKLAIDLAAHLDRLSNKSGWRGAKIINADSMQVYKGLDVITNKVPEPERMGIPHLLMGFKQPGEQYVVGEWIQDALKLVSQRYVACDSLTVSLSLVDKRNA